MKAQEILNLASNGGSTRPYQTLSSYMSMILINSNFEFKLQRVGLQCTEEVLWLVARESFSEDQHVHFSTLVMQPRAGADAWNARLVAASRAKALK